MRKRLVTALALPHIQYCSVVLHGAGVANDCKLQRLANKGILYTYNLPRDASISVYRRELKWLTIPDARMLSIACLVYRVLTGGSPSFLSNLLFARVNARSLRGQGSAQVVVPNYRTDTYKSSFEVSAPIIWNSLPEVVRRSASYHTFKSNIRAHLLDRLTTPDAVDRGKTKLTN